MEADALMELFKRNKPDSQHNSICPCRVNEIYSQCFHKAMKLKAFNSYWSLLHLERQVCENTFGQILSMSKMRRERRLGGFCSEASHFSPKRATYTPVQLMRFPFSFLLCLFFFKSCCFDLSSAATHSPKNTVSKWMHFLQYIRRHMENKQDVWSPS